MKALTIRHTRLNCERFPSQNQLSSCLNEVDEVESSGTTKQSISIALYADSSTANAWIALKLAAQTLVILSCQNYYLTGGRTNPGKVCS